MVLVGYSDSESSGEEKITKAAPKSKATPASKTRAHRFIDSANPHKIKVNLPIPSTDVNDTIEDVEPAPKKAKLSSSGFNAMLPAPKRSKLALASGGRGKGLGSGINLKTGATPGFSRETPDATEYQAEDIHKNMNAAGEDDRYTDPLEAQFPQPVTSEQPKLIGNAMRFKPLSVTRKPKKKSAASLTAVASKPLESIPKPKASLFSVPATDDLSTYAPPAGEYKPIIYNAKPDEADDPREAPPDPIYASDAQPPPQSHAQPESLAAIADNLNLSASQRRQLLGRKNGAYLSNANIVEFNTETEYAANEELRAKGESVTFNPVRSVAGGKHSLQQLVNLVSNQKDALEESFAAGRRNKKEAGAKYGW